MVFPGYLAITAAEFARIHPGTQNLAWMACHFSPYSSGLSNLPHRLSSRSMLILNDRMPLRDHDPQRILLELEQVITQFQCSGLLLDFEQEGNPDYPPLIRTLVEGLPCPVGVCAAYDSGEKSHPVFLPPVPLHIPAEDYLAPWQGRELWLEAALDAQTLTLSEGGVSRTVRPHAFSPPLPHRDATLLCHYRTELSSHRVQFCLSRTQEDLEQLIEKALGLGVTRCIGLWQELGTSFSAQDA